MRPDPAWAAVLFDLDGTLADTVDLILQSFRHTMGVHLDAIPDDGLFLETIGTPLPEQLRDFARSEEEWSAMRTTYAAYQLTLHDEMVQPFPGAVPVMQELRARGSRVGIVTSKGRSIADRTIGVCGFSGLVDFVVCGNEVTHGKPHPEPVLRAMAELDVAETPDRVVFVGDTPHDLRAGRAAGTKTAAVSWGPIRRQVLEAERPDYYVETMEALLSLE